jgi:O-antigen ligase
LSGSPLDRNLGTLLIVIALVILWKRGKQIKSILVLNPWLIALFAYIALSVIWSNFPGVSFRRCFRATGAFVMVLVVLTERDPLMATATLLRRVYLIHIPLSIVAIKYFRNIGVVYDWSGSEEMWVGLTVHKNSLGQVAMCSGLLFSWQVLQKWGKKTLTVDLLLLALTLWLLKGSKNSHSSTAILGFIFCAIILVGLQFITKRAAHAKRIILTALVVSALVGPVVYMVFEAFDTTPVGALLEATGRNMTFTGRTALWQDLLASAARNPVLGVGYGAFWVGEAGRALYPLPNWDQETPGWRPNEGHNGFIDVYVEVGVVGLVLVLVVIGSGVAGAINTLRNEYAFGRLRLVLLLGVLMNNITESSLLNGAHSFWFIFLLVAVHIPTEGQRVKWQSPMMLDRTSWVM